jgi:DNA polymerase-1
MSEKRLFLLDGMALAYRGHFALMRNPRIASTGMNTSAVFVFASTLLDIINNQQPSHIAVVFDTPEPTHRHIRHPEYKAQRDEMPEDLVEALPYIFRLCEGFSMPVIRMPGWEADDVIGTLARQAEADGFTTYMVTPDKDYGQLVDEHTFMYKPGGTGSGSDIMGVPQILERWQIERIDQVIDILGLMGDQSDNVPGVPGIGEKTAQKLIGQFGTVENLLDNLDQLKGKQRERLEENRDLAKLSKELVTISCDVPVQQKPADLALKPWDEAALKILFTELEFNTFGQRLFGEDFTAAPRGTAALAAEIDPENLKTIQDVPHEYILVDTAAARAELIKALNERDSYCFDLETTKLDPKTCKIIGFAFAWEAHRGFYAVLPQDEAGYAAVLEEFRPLLACPKTEKIGHNLKFDLSVLRWRGIKVAGPLFDTMLAAHLAVPDLRRSMDFLAQALLHYKPVSITELIGERGEDQLSMDLVALDTLSEYAAEDADITYQLSEVLRPLLKECGQEDIFYQVECPLVPVLVDMEFHGIRMEVDTIRKLSEELGVEIGRTAERIHQLAGEAFDLNSPKQMGQILFDKLKLDPNARRTQKSGQYSTNEQTLRRLASKHAVVPEILDYRMFSKLKSTYLDTLPGSVFAGTGHVHTHYEQAVTATGRMQSSGPNLQNIPIRTEQGRKIRQAFVASGEDYVLFSADYSQIELRIIAELGQVDGMLEAFKQDEDIHSSTAMRIYQVNAEAVTADMRRKAKTVNFGIIYGISAFGLAERLDINRTQAAELIEQYFEQYPEVKRYMDQTVEAAREKGYVETLLGRRRYLRDIQSRNATTRKGAERNAINAPIQGTAADMIKIAMHKIYAELEARDLKTRMLLQVHDELVFDLHRDEAEVVPSLVEEAMKTAIPMSVPLAVESGIGNTWLEAH